MQHVRKLGASALVIAAAFAVAFAVLLSAPADTAEAQVATASGTTIKPGKTIYVSVNSTDGPVRFEIDALSTATGSFTANGGQSIVCNNAGKCDAKTDHDNDGATPPEEEDGTIVVALKVASDSPDGFIIVKTTHLTASPPTEAYQNFNVKTGQVIGAVSIKATTSTIPATAPTSGGTSTITVTVSDTEDKLGIPNTKVTLVTTNGLLTVASDGQHADGAACADVQACTLTTRVNDNDDDNGLEAGTVIVELKGSGRAGEATVTATAGTKSAAKEFVLSGEAKTLAASAEQGSVELGGSVFVVLTVTDAAGNPIRGHTDIAAPIGKDITGPTDDANNVRAIDDRDKDANGNRKVDKGDIPACGNDEDATENSTNLTTGDGAGTNDGVDVPAGTNDDGQCVVQVTTSATPTTTRGEHTLKFKLSSAENADTASVVITVSGPPVSITSDAPARIASSDEVTVNILVVDDQGARVGAVLYQVIKTAGDGAIVSGETGDNSMTSDGRAKFTYLAASTSGVVEFLVRTRDKNDKVTARHPIVINIGPEPVEEAPPEPPAPSLSRTPAPTGFTLVTFSGGTVAQLSDVLVEACGDGVRAWASDYQGRYVGLFPSAPAIVNNGFNQLFSDGVPAGEALIVGNCGG